MTSQEVNRRFIADETKGPSYLGILVEAFDEIPPVPWGTRPWCVEEIRRWMASVSFGDGHALKDCDGVFALFNIGSARDSIISDSVAKELQRRLLDYMKHEELPRLKQEGIVRGHPGTWDPRANFAWARDDWSGDISLAWLERACTATTTTTATATTAHHHHRHDAPKMLSDVMSEERESKQKYDAARADLDGMTQRYMQLFADFQHQSLEHGWMKDEGKWFIERLMAAHARSVREQLDGMRVMLEAYRVWQMNRTNRKMWEAKLSATAGLNAEG